MRELKDFLSEDHDPENCPGCRPVVFDPNTGAMNEDLTAAAGRVFDKATPEAKRAWHRVTCLNSRDLIDVNLAKGIVDALQKGMQ